MHRLLKYHLRKDGLPSGGSSHPPPPPRLVLQAMAQESSAHERRAVVAEREIVDMYRAFLMRDRIGEELDGVISGVQAFGVFVECIQPFVEGLVRTETLGDDSFEYDEVHLRLTGRRTGRTLSLGDEVRVKVENVSVGRRRIDLALLSGGGIAEVDADKPKTRSRGKRETQRAPAPDKRKGGQRKRR